MRDELITRTAVMEALKKEYNLRHRDGKGLQLAYIEKSVNSVSGWIPVEERVPETDDYVLVSFENYSLPDIGRCEGNEDEGYTFYPGDENKSYSSYGLIVNAWMPLPKCYRGE